MSKSRKTIGNPHEIKLNRVAKTIIRRALREDMRNRGDITTRASVPTDMIGKAVIIARSDGVIAGQRIAEAVFTALDKQVRYQPVIQDGENVPDSETLATISGKMWAILAGERTALNILGRCSGIATLTRRFTDAIAGTDARITETRKTAPGLRYLDKAAVAAGGGVNHRYGLHDAFLLKENHIAAVGGITEAIQACRTYARKHGRFRIMVETTNIDEYREALSSMPDRILLDNMSPAEIKDCVAVREGNVELEATGGIVLENVREYAETGVDFISLGVLTHSVKALDVSLLVVKQDHQA